MKRWVECPHGQGRRIENGLASDSITSFGEHSVGYVETTTETDVHVVLAKDHEMWAVPLSEVIDVDVTKTGDKFDRKICNRCHCILPVDKFPVNQTNKHGPIRRPTCVVCRTKIDNRHPKSQQAKQMMKKKPLKGTPFRCPICEKHSIAHVTAKIVADHDHRTGDIRDFICDSCNTGLGRFKNGRDCLRNALNYLKRHDKL